MPIPKFTEEGFLPPGIHECTLEEIRTRLGTFQASDRRPRLYAGLRAFLDEVRRAGIFEAVLLDGSFVTANPDPNDIDIVMVFSATHNFEEDLAPHQYQLLLPIAVRKRWGFDVILAQANSEAYVAAVEFFHRVRDQAGKKKGLLKLRI